MSIRYCARCVQCLGRGRSVYLSILPFRPFSSSFRPSTSETSKPSSSKHEPLHSPDSLDSTTALAKAREEAWYLEDDDPPISSPSPSSTQSSSPTTRQPQFTTFDPNRTSIDLPSTSVAPLPSSAPPYLVPLHTFLTSPQAGDVLDPSSVVFIDTNNMPDEMKEEGEVIKGSKEGARPNWDWIVVMVVKGHGKGVIRRAERAIRLWVGWSSFVTQPRHVHSSHRCLDISTSSYVSLPISHLSRRSEA